LHVLNGLDPCLGGPPVAVRNIVVATSREGIEVELAACDGGGPHIDDLVADLGKESVTLRWFPITGGRADPLVRWGASALMLRYLWQRIPDFDVVHLHGAWSFPSLLGAARARVRALPIVLTPHETLTEFDIEHARSMWRTKQKRAVGSALVRLVDVILFSSDIEHRDSRIARSADCRVRAHPVVDERVPPGERGSSDDAPLRVGFLGRLHPKKNLPALIDAVAQCAAVRLIVAGSGPDEAKCRAQANSLSLNSRVEWLGFVAGAGKNDFFGSIDLLAMPSLYECFGVSAAEAMAAGVPVLVSNTVGIAQVVVAHGAGVVTGNDSKSIAAAITRLQDDRTILGRCRRGAAQAAREQFSFADFGREIERIYRDLVTRRRRKDPDAGAGYGFSELLRDR
jgi:glycosyltransferase involved in cell wall biosynthesis